jgi:hypothetical protein
LDEDYSESGEMIDFFDYHHWELKIVDKPLAWYDKKVALFKKFLEWKNRFNLEK